MTKAQFEAYKMTIPGAKPFAGDATVAGGGIIVPGASTGSFSMPDGFGATYDSAPDTATGSNMVQRGQINYIGRMASYVPFMGKVGSDFWGFDPAVATSPEHSVCGIGGYPQGAILTLVKNGCYLKIISLVDNNKVDFTGGTDTTAYPDVTNGTVDGVNWQYLSLDPQTLIDQSILVEIPNMTVARHTCSVLGCFKAYNNGAVVINGGVDMEDLTPGINDEQEEPEEGEPEPTPVVSLMTMKIIVSGGQTSVTSLHDWTPVNSSQTPNGTVIWDVSAAGSAKMMTVEKDKWYGIGMTVNYAKLTSSTMKVRIVVDG